MVIDRWLGTSLVAGPELPPHFARARWLRHGARVGDRPSLAIPSRSVIPPVQTDALSGVRSKHVSSNEYLDLEGCAAMLGLPVRRLRKLVQTGTFAEPAGRDGAPFWRMNEVWRWAGRQGPTLSHITPLQYWPTPANAADFVGSTRVPNRYCRDDVILEWQVANGLVAVVWRSDDPIMLKLSDFLSETDAQILVTVDPNFGIDGPTLWVINRTSPDPRYEIGWSELARVLGQPMPYWPLPLRDPALIAEWSPGASTIEVPTRPDLDVAPLLRMAAMFHRDHATHRTLLELVSTVQDRSTASACGDLEILAETAKRQLVGDEPATVLAARPLIIPEHAAPTEELDPTTRRIGWLELLGRRDSLSRECVEQMIAWDGGDDFPFSGVVDIEPGTAHGHEWIARLEPIQEPTAAFVALGTAGVDWTGPMYQDPATGAPVARNRDDTYRTVAAQRLPTLSPLAEVVMSSAVWVRVADGTLYLAPRSPSRGLSWGYSGTGPTNLARLTEHLIDDITANPADIRGRPSEGLRALMTTKWPAGTVLDRDLLESARRGERWDHPNRPD